MSALARFDALFAEHRRPVLAYAMRRTPTLADAEDVAAETFIIAWRKMDSIPADGLSPADRHRQPPYRPNCSSACAASRPPIASELVAAGEGALRTWISRPLPARSKSSTSEPSRPNAWARTPDGPKLS